MSARLCVYNTLGGLKLSKIKTIGLNYRASIKTYVIKSEREFASNDFLTVLTRIQLHRKAVTGP